MDAHAMLRQQLGNGDETRPNTHKTRSRRASAKGRTPPPPPPQPSISSYWSVAEQRDFIAYIAYFGRDFAAIAARMITKTQTMVKNHYQRQIEGGNNPELEQSAMMAEERRVRGEDMGPPPSPTTVVREKYDSDGFRIVPKYLPVGIQDTLLSRKRANTSPIPNRSRGDQEQETAAMPIRCKSISDDATNQTSQAQQAAMLRRVLLSPRS